MSGLNASTSYISSRPGPVAAPQISQHARAIVEENGRDPPVAQGNDAPSIGPWGGGRPRLCSPSPISRR